MILFLDFDGVLHPNSDDSEHFSCAPLLWELLRRHPDVRVVLSTGWRFERPLDELRRLACQNGGEDVAERVIDATPLLRHDADEQSLKALKAAFGEYFGFRGRVLDQVGLSHAAERRANQKDDENNAVYINSHQPRRALINRRCADRRAEFGFLDKQIQSDHQDH